MQALPSKKRASDILEWKKLAKIKESYFKLYNKETSVTENITKLAFLSISDKNKSFNDIYMYTAAVCDIVLNPDYPNTECGKKLLK